MACIQEREISSATQIAHWAEPRPNGFHIVHVGTSQAPSFAFLLATWLKVPTPDFT